MQKLAWGLMALVALGAATPAAAEEQTSTAISEIRHETSERSTRLTAAPRAARGTHGVSLRHDHRLLLST